MNMCLRRFGGNSNVSSGFGALANQTTPSFGSLGAQSQGGGFSSSSPFGGGGFGSQGSQPT